MRLMGKFAVLGLLVAGSTVALVHADEPTTKPAKEMHGPRLIKPYADMKTLTPDVKEKISAIHKKAVEDEAAIKDKEDADILAILSPDQKAELETLNDAKKVKSKTKAADKKSKATTEPAKD